MTFPSPQTVDPDDRLEEVTNHSYEALEALLAEAYRVGWSIQEVTEAMVLAAESLRVATQVNIDAVTDQARRTIDPSVEQIGRGEQYD